MALAQITNLEKTYGERVLFRGLDFSIDRGERVGLIGENGAGKTSLFRALVGDLVPDAGTTGIAKGVRIGHLRQDPAFTPGSTLIDEAESAFDELHRLSHTLRDLEHAMAEQQGDALEKTLERYESARHRFDTAGGYAWRHKLEATLHGVGLHEPDWEKSTDSLSGGQRSRLALAKLLVAEPDLLLLDEPTNHLDLQATEWLEEWLAKFDGATLLISHDRYLLDRLTTRIVWLTEHRLLSYPGNYSAFVTQRDLHELTRQRAYAKQQADIEKQAEFVRRFKAGQRARQAKGREKRLVRLLASDQIVSGGTREARVRLSISTDRRAGDRVLAVRELGKTYGQQTLWRDVAFEIARGDRVGVIGPNGAGKTTLLRVLVGETDADAGDVRWGANLSLGYYDQRLDDFDPDNTVFEEIAEGRTEPEQTLRDALGAMLFRGNTVDKPMSLLSGGERARVALVKLLLEKPNVLLLDEPTNHLDIASREALEATLRNFPGTILCVSHDRYFLEQIATRLLVLDPPNATVFDGSYHEWHEKHHAPTPSPSPEPRRATDDGRRTRDKAQASKDNPYLRPFGRLTPEQLETRITDAETAVADAQQRLADADTYKTPGDARRVQQAFDQAAKELEALEAEYFARG